MMNPIVTGLIVFGCTFGGALLGMLICGAVPEQHVGGDSKDIIKLAIGLVGTMTALVVGLLIASAKGTYDSERTELTQMSAKIILLDVVLANYGPDAQPARDLLRASLARVIERIWPKTQAQAPQLDPTAMSGEPVYKLLLELSPKDDTQKTLKTQALTMAGDIGQMRWLLFEQAGGSISIPFLFMVVFWLAIIFISFGLFAPSNATVITSLCVCALSVSFAIFLITELDRPFGGFIQISDAPLNSALAHLDH
jgi:hypothetical protein